MAIKTAVAAPSEMHLQAAFIEWVNLMGPQHPALGLLYAIPNEGFTSKLNGWKRKLMGRRAGVPDIHLPVQNNHPKPYRTEPWESFHPRYIGLWLEFKTAKGRVSPDQKLWHGQLRMAGHRVEVVRSTEAAIEIVKEYLGI